MNEAKDRDDALRPVRLLVGALASGVVLFAGVAIVVRRRGGFDGDSFEPIPVIALVFTVAAVALRPLIVHALVRASLRQRERGGLRIAPGEDAGDAVYRGVTVAGAAILEGAGLFCLVAYLLSGRTALLGAGLAMPVLILVFHWPTPVRARAFRARYPGVTPPRGGQ